MKRFMFAVLFLIGAILMCVWESSNNSQTEDNRPTNPTIEVGQVLGEPLNKFDRDLDQALENAFDFEVGERRFSTSSIFETCPI